MNTTHEPRPTTIQRHDVRKADHQPGYLPVLVREELKVKIREWRITRALRDSHFERCLVSACVEMGLELQNETRLMELLAQAVAKDFQFSLSGRQAPESHIPV
jgi:hypothetical protein